MNPTFIYTIIASVLLFISCKNQVEYGLYTEDECPIEIPEELASSGKFLYGYMTVPEVHSQNFNKAIELAVPFSNAGMISPLVNPG